MNIFLRELKANLKSLLIWSVIIVLLIVMAVAKFSAFAGDPEMLAMLDAMPPAMLDAFSLRAFNLTTVSGFFGIMFIYFALDGRHRGRHVGQRHHLQGRARQDGRVLAGAAGLAQPGHHRQGAGALVNCIAFVLVTWGVSLVAVQPYKPDQAFYNFLALEMEAMFVIELIFLAIGLLLGCAMKQYKRSGSTAVAIILLAYFLSIVTGMNKDLDFLKYFTPFKYFDAAQLLSTGQMDGPFLLLSAAIIVVCVAAAYWTYNQRDLYI